MLAVATAWKFNESDFVYRINFVMTDSNAHNFGVIEDVFSELQVENIPDSCLPCASYDVSEKSERCVERNT